MDPKVKHITLWTQAREFKLVGYSKTGLEKTGFRQSLVDPCLFYRKYSVILTYVDDCVIVSQNKKRIT